MVLLIPKSRNVSFASIEIGLFLRMALMLLRSFERFGWLASFCFGFVLSIFSIFIESSQEREFTDGVMGGCTLETTSKTKKKALEFIAGRTAEDTKDNG